MEEGHTRKRRLKDDPEAGTKRKKKKKQHGAEAVAGAAVEHSSEANGVVNSTAESSKRKNAAASYANSVVNTGMETPATPEKRKNPKKRLVPETTTLPHSSASIEPDHATLLPLLAEMRKKKSKKNKGLANASHAHEDAASPEALLSAPNGSGPFDPTTATLAADKPKKRNKKDREQEAGRATQNEPQAMKRSTAQFDYTPAESAAEVPKTPKRKHSEVNVVAEEISADAKRPKKKKKKKHVDAEPKAVELEAAARPVQDVLVAIPISDPNSQEMPRKKKRRKKQVEAETIVDGDKGEPAIVNEPEPLPQTPIQETKRKKRKDKGKKLEIEETPAQRQEAPSNSAAAEVEQYGLPSTPPPTALADETPRRAGPLTRQQIGLREVAEQRSPIIKQTQCIWVPMYPKGFDEPISAAIDQHLKPRLYRFDETLKGVLLSYENVCLNSKPTRKGGATRDTDQVYLLSTQEYGVAYCWLIADLELFVPKRGATMLGEIVLQNAGHIGVLCWGKFNASIEKKRLPRQWRWEDNSFRAASVELDGEEDDQNQFIRTLGSWIDENGEPITGQVAFRIKNYDVGLSGDHAFLCIEGTMLSDKREAKLRQEELQEMKRLKSAKSPWLVGTGREVPEFGFTDLGVDEEVKQERQKGWRSSRSRSESRGGATGGGDGGRGSRASSKGPEFVLTQADLES